MITSLLLIDPTSIDEFGKIAVYFWFPIFNFSFSFVSNACFIFMIECSARRVAGCEPYIPMCFEVR